jgi:hypothetical protein
MTQTTHISRNNTTVSKPADGPWMVRLHQTPIVRVTNPTASDTRLCVIELNTGGYITATTMNRMNQTAAEWGLGYRVSRKKGRMIVTWRGFSHVSGTGRVRLLPRGPLASGDTIEDLRVEPPVTINITRNQT